MGHHQIILPYGSYDAFALSRGVALAGRAIREFVRGGTNDVVAGARVVPALVGRRAVMDKTPADFGRSWSRTTSEDGRTCDNTSTGSLVLTADILTADILAAALCGRLLVPVFR